jgi:hypothetical protein
MKLRLLMVALAVLIKAKWVIVVALASFVVAGTAKADIVYNTSRQVVGSGGNNVPFYDDGTPGYPGGPGVGQTIILGGTARDLTTITIFEGNGGGNTGSYILTLYSGSDPNTGTELGSVTLGSHSGLSYDVFDFTSQNIFLPNTITFIVSSGPGGFNGVGSADASGPTVGSAVNSIWYGAPGSYVANNTWAIADFATPAPPFVPDNYLTATINANVPDGGMTIMLLGGALVGFETLRRRFRV